MTTEIKKRCPDCGAQGKVRSAGYIVKPCKRCDGTGYLNELPYPEAKVETITTEDIGNPTTPYVSAATGIKKRRERIAKQKK